jgi:hypothetical protein
MNKLIRLMIVLTAFSVTALVAQTPTPAPSPEASATVAKHKHSKKKDTSPSASAAAAESPAAASPSPTKRPWFSLKPPSPTPATSPVAATSPAGNTSTTAKTTKPVEPIGTPAVGGGPGMVWVNTETHVYHKEGSRWYGRTKHGKYLKEQDAMNEGDHADKEESKAKKK